MADHFVFMSFPSPIHFLFISYSNSYLYPLHMQFLFISCSFLMHFQFNSYSFTIHSYLFPIHFSSFHFQRVSKTVVRKWKEMKWSEWKGQQKQPMIQCRIPIHNPMQNPVHSPQYMFQYRISGTEDSRHNQLNNFISYPQLLGGHYQSLLCIYNHVCIRIKIS